MRRRGDCFAIRAIYLLQIIYVQSIWSGEWSCVERVISYCFLSIPEFHERACYMTRTVDDADTMCLWIIDVSTRLWIARPLTIPYRPSGL
jgi:hypothetical protein